MAAAKVGQTGQLIFTSGGGDLVKGFGIENVNADGTVDGFRFGNTSLVTGVAYVEVGGTPPAADKYFQEI